MPRFLKISSALAGLLLVIALAGCGKSETEEPQTIPSSATGATVSGATSVVPPTGVTSEATVKQLGPASQRFAAKLDATCREFDSSEAEVYYVDAYASGEDPIPDLDDMVASYRGILRKAEKLDPPAASKQEFDAYVASLRALVKQAGPLKVALKSGNVEQAADLDGAFTAALYTRNEAALRLGAENCIMDSAD